MEFSLKFLNTLLTISGNITDFSGLSGIRYVRDNFRLSSTQTTSLNGLDSLRTVGGYFLISGNLTDVNGLSHLTEVGSYLSFNSNTALLNLDGLSSLTTIQRDLLVIGNASLTSISGLSALTSIGGYAQIRANRELTSLNGLEQLTTVGGYLTITDNLLLSNCTGICNLLNADGVSGSVTISGNPAGCSSTAELTLNCIPSECPPGDVSLLSQADVDVFVSNFASCDSIFGDLILRGNITDLSGLSSIVYVQGDFNLTNSAIAQLNGLDALQFIGGNFKIENCGLLTDISALSQLNRVEGFFTVQDNNRLTSLSGLELLMRVGELFLIRDNDRLSNCSSICDLINSDSIGGGILISGNPSECSTVNEVRFLCAPPVCPPENITLRTQFELNAFVQTYSSCDSVAGDLIIQNGVNDLSDLSFIRSIGGYLRIQFASQLESLDGLQNLEQIGGNLYLESPGALNSVAGFSSLQSIGGGLVISQADNLLNLNGFEQLTSIGNFLTIQNNPQLSDCAGICNVINDGVGGRITISGNPSECSTTNEVQLICTPPAVCPPTSTTLNTQAELNAFVQAYFTCDSVAGNLIIQGVVTDLSDLSFIKYIDGDLTIQGSSQYETLDGLQNIEQIGGSLTLESLGILNSVAGFSSLQSVGGNLRIVSCAKLPKLTGFEQLMSVGGSLTIQNNVLLSDCSGLCQVIDDGVQGTITITGNPSECSSLNELTFLCFPTECPTGNVALTNQAEVDDFVSRYGNCDSLPGHLDLSGNISDLSGLTFIKHIEGRLDIFRLNNLTAVSGFSGLRSVGGDFRIFESRNLTNLSGFEQLLAVGGDFRIEGNSTLSDCSGICSIINNGIGGSITITNNPSECSTVNEVRILCAPTECPPGNVVLTSQNEVDAFVQAYSNCDSLPGHLDLSGNISDLSGLTFIKHIEGRLDLFRLSNLTSVSGFSGLRSVGGDFRVFETRNLTNLSGFEQLLAVGGDFRIEGNSTLSDCSGICSIINNGIGGSITITNNPSECSTINEVRILCAPTECPPGNVILTSQNEVDAFVQAYSNCDSLPGHLDLSGNISDLSGLTFIKHIEGRLDLLRLNNLTSVSGFSGLRSVGGDFRIFESRNLTNLSGFEQLLTVGGDFTIQGNSTLSDCSGICSIINTGVGGNITITNNPSECSTVNEVRILCATTECPPGNVVLTSQNEVDAFVQAYSNCDSLPGHLDLSGNISDLSGLTFIKHIEGRLDILRLNNLTSVSGFSGLRSVGGDFRIFESRSLTNLSGFEQLLTVGGDFTIQGNSTLSDCSGICSIINTGVGGNITITNNPSECSTVNEVRILCASSACPPGNVVLTNQQEVNAFVQAYSNCDSLPGNLDLSGNINDLSGFTFIKHIEGRLDILRLNNLSAVEGFSGLNSIGGDFRIFETNNLPSLAGFEQLTSVGGNFTIQGNRQLSDCSGICNLVNDGIGGSITITNNPSECSTANEVRFICAVTDCPSGDITLSSQVEVNAFVQAYSNCDSLPGDLVINGDVDDLSGMNFLKHIGGALQIFRLNNLTSVAGFSGLQSVGGTFLISGNNNLPSLTGFEQVESVGGDIVIQNNQQLTDCELLCDLINNGFVGGALVVSGNPSMCTANDIQTICARVPNDLAVLSLVQPDKATILLPGINEVQVVLHNNGTDTLYNATLNWSVNNVAKPAANWTGVLYPQARDTFVLGTHDFVPTLPHAIQIQSSNPNGLADGNVFNDSLFVDKIYTSLSGGYTVGGLNPDFVTLTDVALALNLGGVHGAVRLNLRDGSYEDRIRLDSIKGAAADRTIVFQSESGDAEKVTFYYLSNSNRNSNSSILELNGTSHLEFRDMTFESNFRAETIVTLRNGANNIRFSNSIFLYEKGNDARTAIWVTGAKPCHFIQFDTNVFRNGRRGIDFGSGNVNAVNQGNKVERNLFYDQTSRGLNMSYQSQLLVQQNEFDTDVANNYYAMALSFCENASQVRKNKIRNADISGIYLKDCMGSAVNPMVIANNFIHLTGTANGSGLEIIDGNHQHFYFNSVHVTNTNNNSTALRINSTQEVVLQNNIFYNASNGLSIYLANTNGLSVSDYNDFYSAGSRLAVLEGSSISDLSNWQSATGKDANSKSVVPLYFSDTDLHVAQVELNEAGTPIVGIPTDIDGDTRNASTPDIGADEFSLIQNDIGVIRLISPLSSCDMGASEKVVIEVQNYSGTTISNFEVAYRLNGADPLVESIGSVSIPPGGTMIHEFQTPIDISAVGEYTFELFTLLNGDSRPQNDTLTSSIRSIPELVVPANFSPADGATKVNTGTLLSWSPVTGADYYDVYLWKEGDPQPTQSITKNFKGIALNVSSEPNQIYNWQVVAKTDYCETAGPILSFQTQGLSNLMVDSIIVPTGVVYSGQPLDLSWIVKNSGAGDTENAIWTDRISISDDTIYHSGNIDPYLKAVKSFSALDPDSSYLQTSTVILPRNITGEYYVFVRTDDRLRVKEENESDNTSYSAKITVLLTPPADLQLSEIQTPSNTVSGSPINITYTVTNDKEGETPADFWKDRVYISPDTLLNSEAILLNTNNHSGILQGDSSYSVSLDVDIPIYLSGEHYILVQTDYTNLVYEFANEANNVGVSRPINVFLAQLPDFRVTDFVAPEKAANNETVQLSWQVINSGVSDAHPNWNDNIYISPTLKDTIPDDAEYLGDSYLEDTVKIGNVYFTTAEVSIPDEITGPYYLYLSVDGENELFESVGDANNVSRLPVEILSPDLSIPALSLSENALSTGDTVLLEYELQNNGLATIIERNWKDLFYLSPTAELDLTTAIKLDSIVYTDISMNGDVVLLKSKLVRIPDGLDGGFYLIGFADREDEVYEGNLENNNAITSSLLTINLSPWPNLQVTNAAAVPTAKAGEFVPIDFQITNTGIGEITADGIWEDVIYISNSPFWDPDDAQIIGQIRLEQSLAAAQNYSTTRDIQIPIGLSSGNYYLHYFVDHGKNIYEHTDEGDNIYTSAAFFVTGHPPVDLEANSITGPLSINSGEVAAFSWRVTNQANVPTITRFWEDAIYLSTDTTWQKNSDILVASRTILPDLAASESYSRDLNAAIPNGTAGDYYLMIVSDYQEKNNDSYRPNNVQMMVDSEGEPVTVTVGLTPPPDLLISSFVAPDEGPAGQVIQVDYAITNAGSAAIPFNKWNDHFFLSADTELSQGDYPLATVLQSRTLDKDEVYEEQVEIVLPNDLSGNWYLIFKTDYTDKIYEHTNEGNNTVVWNLTIGQPLPADLIVTDIDIRQLELLPGEAVDISWTIQNQEMDIAEGRMKEAVFISDDPVWDINDPLLATVTKDIYLPFNETLTDSITVDLAGVPVGNYYIIVRTDLQNNIFENNTTNNVGVSNEQIQVDVPQLFLDVPIRDSLYNLKPAYYRLEIPSTLKGESLLLSLNGNPLIGSNELYMRYEAIPTRTVYDYSHAVPYQGEQEIIVSELQAGTYYIMKYGSTLAGVNQADTLLARILEFELIEIDKNEGGNTGMVTVKLRGSKFDPMMDVWLRSASGGTIEGSLHTFIDQTEAFYSFFLGGVKVGLYDVLASNSAGNQLLMPNGFRVVEGEPRELAFNIINPSVIAVFSINKTTIEYTNNGNTDIVNPIIQVRSITEIPIGLSVEDLKKKQIELMVPLSEVNGPPDILRPGASGTIVIYAKANLDVLITIQEIRETRP